MTDPATTPEERFAGLVDVLLAEPNVAQRNRAGFGSSALWVKGKIFVMLMRGGELVVKLPEHRVDELIAAGAGDRFEASAGRRMKEWLTLGPTCDDEWLPLAREAMRFVACRP